MFTSVLFMAALAADSSSIAGQGSEFSRSSTEIVRSIVAGWNLGNTLESHDSNHSWPSTITPTYAETKWWNPPTTQEMFDRVAQTGFSAVRIPVTWDMFTAKDDSGRYIIDSAYLKRVQEVVSYALKNDLFVIVNMHHDDKRWIDLTKSDKEWAEIVDKYRQLWTIIADSFKDCGEKLILEAGNEMVAGNDWWGKEQSYFDRQNELYKIFYQTVRASGGKNALRYLAFPTYGAQWYPYQYQKLWIPENDSRLICDIHWYSAKTDAREYLDAFQKMSDYFKSKGVAVIMGECGLQKSNVFLASDWAPAFVGSARKFGVPCFLWDDGGNFQILDRKKAVWKNESYVRSVLDAAEGKSLAAPKKGKAGDIQFQNWYCNGAESIIEASGAPRIVSGDTFTRQIQPCYNFSQASTEALKKMARRSKDGFVYLKISGRFETGSDTNKLFIKGGLKEGGGWDVGSDWQYTLVSGGEVTIPFPVEPILNGKTVSLTLQLNNYTYGSGLRNLRVVISPPEVR